MYWRRSRSIRYLNDANSPRSSASRNPAPIGRPRDTRFLPTQAVDVARKRKYHPGRCRVPQAHVLQERGPRSHAVAPNEPGRLVARLADPQVLHPDLLGIDHLHAGTKYAEQEIGFAAGSERGARAQHRVEVANTRTDGTVQRHVCRDAPFSKRRILSLPLALPWTKRLGPAQVLELLGHSNASAHDRHRCIVCEDADEATHPVRRNATIVVRERDDVAATQFHAEVAPGRYASCLRPHVAQPRIGNAGECIAGFRAVTLIDDDELRESIGRENRPGACKSVGRPKACRHDN